MERPVSGRALVSPASPGVPVGMANGVMELRSNQEGDDGYEWFLEADTVPPGGGSLSVEEYAALVGSTLSRGAPLGRAPRPGRPRVRVPLVFGWSMMLWPVPVPCAQVGGLAVADCRYDCLVPGSVVLVLWSGRGRFEAVWERRRCGGRGGWLPLGLRASSFLANGRLVVLPVGRAVGSLEGVLGRLASSAGLRPGGSVVRSALRAFPPGRRPGPRRRPVRDGVLTSWAGRYGRGMLIGLSPRGSHEL